MVLIIYKDKTGMNKLFFILFYFVSLTLNATKYYVAITGDDDAAGTIASPWKTWGKAFNSTDVDPGDTVYFRGGVYAKVLSEGDDGWYYPNRASGGTGYGTTRAGTAGNLVKYWAYPGETPILDCNETNIGSNIYNYGIRSMATFVHFKGLTVRNVRQYAPDTKCWGFLAKGNGTIVENCTVYNVGGCGFYIGNAAGENINVINCDAHHCCDSLDLASPGNDGYGFTVLEAAGNVYFKGCRAWMNGDDGFNAGILYEIFNTQYIEYDSCWSIKNGMLDGGGSGFKLGWANFDDGTLARTYTHCIAAFNRWNGWKTNDMYGNHAIISNLYNNISYHNGYSEKISKYGFSIHNTKDIDADELKRVYRNNISYANEDGPVTLVEGSLYTHSNNSWDGGATITNEDFLSIDSTGITGARQADGSLPDIDFLKLSRTSDAIDAGTDVGLAYEGTAPDLGWHELIFAEEPSVPYIATSTITQIRVNSVVSGGYMISDGGGTISAKGLCYSRVPDPDLADSVIVSGTGTDDFAQTITGLTGNTIYYVRAYATNETGTAYGATEIFTTSIYSVGRYQGKTGGYNGKIGLYKTNKIDADTLGPELVVDGGFDNPGLWTCGTGWSVTGGKAVAVDVVQYTSTVKQMLEGLEENTIYKIVFTISDYSSGAVEVGLCSNYAECCSSDGTFTKYINTLTAPNSYIAIRNYAGSAANFKIDNLSVKKVL